MKYKYPEPTPKRYDIGVLSLLMYIGTFFTLITPGIYTLAMAFTLLMAFVGRGVFTGKLVLVLGTLTYAIVMFYASQAGAI